MYYVNCNVENFNDINPNISKRNLLEGKYATEVSIGCIMCDIWYHFVYWFKSLDTQSRDNEIFVDE